MNPRLLLTVLCPLFLSALTGRCQDGSMRPLFVLSEKTSLPVALTPYQTAMEALLKEVSGKRPSKLNPIELVPELTFKNFFEVLGMPLPGTHELTVYEISVRSAEIDG